jgi:tetratricopeptide (TPR) repeat protein
MPKGIRRLALAGLASVALACVAWAQSGTGFLEGTVKGEDGKGMPGALIKLERTDVKGNYQVKTDKKGHWFHAGLPLGGNFKVYLVVEGKEVDAVQGIKVMMDGKSVDFDMAQIKARGGAGPAAGAAPAETGRGMSAAEKAALEKQVKEREQAMAKNKALNDAFTGGMTAMTEKRYDDAVTSFTKASELDANQHVVWAQLASALVESSASKTGADRDAALNKGLEAYAKAIELKADDAAYHNNYALALARAKKIPEAQAELTKAAQIDPPGAGKYYYNLGALLVNSGQMEAAGETFKKVIEVDPTYADAHYQYGIYMLSKASTAADGKVTPIPGTKEEFEKYLQLQPSGQFADAAKGMIATLDSTVSTKYENPAAAAAAQKKAASKKK